jgi:hypothetical protein
MEELKLNNAASEQTHNVDKATEDSCVFCAAPKRDGDGILWSVRLGSCGECCRDYQTAHSVYNRRHVCGECWSGLAARFNEAAARGASVSAVSAGDLPF